ncbi:hypothetical protein NQ176_g6534 [Zarea fungicola]|uniref:Uncharacterized protein n=1 Tax=Zarea fungicola TaxID=93591 RepID=A0ACC1N3A8_9HYPO|nr:hypothetical protein NQ176_g6534 [Lecanicillium fungicola]
MPSFTKLVSLALGAVATTAGSHEDRQLHSLPNQESSSSTTTSSSASTSTPSPMSASTTLATQTGSTRWELTTVFTQPTDCVGGITQYAGDLSTLGYWLNIPYPAPGITITSCFPPALVASVTAAVDLPPDFRLHAPGLVSNTDRPGLGAWCTSWAVPGTHAALTRYFTTGGSSLIDTTLGTAENWLVQATAFDGMIATSVPTSTSTSSTTSSSSSPSETSTSSTPTVTKPPTSSSSATPTSTWSGATAVSQLPSCGQTCFGNMLAQYQALGCSTNDPACLCRNVNFGYGIRDCANGACGVDVGSTVIAFETGYYCPSAVAARTTTPTASPTPTAVSQLPTCGQTCFKNMEGQYSQLGCSSPQASCLCKNPNFGFGIRDCSNGACGPLVGSTVIAFASSWYCATATPVPS